MSKAVKTVVKIALPVALSLAAPGIGTALGSTLSAATLSSIGGAVGGAISGGIGGGGLPGIAMGALGGYATGGMVGSPAGTSLAEVTGNAAAQGPTYGSGIAGAVTGGGMRALLPTVTQTAATDPLKYLSTIGNQLVAQGNADTATSAAKTMSGSIDKALSTQAPYTKLGANAASQIQSIQADPAGYIKNNPLYTSLAADAERRLTAVQAARGKLGSGGTTSALQEQLLGLGTGLVNNQIANLQTQVNTGANAANSVGNLYGNQGAVQAAGQVGANNAMVSGYQNQLNTLLALQNANKNTYMPQNI